MNREQMRELVHRFHNDARPPDAVYNILTGEAGVVLEMKPGDDRSWISVVVIVPPHTEQGWYREYCIPEWERLPMSYRSFIHEYMHPIYKACLTLDMHSDMQRVFTLARVLCFDEGEACSAYMLDTLMSWTGNDPVSTAVRNAICEYITTHV